MTRQTFSERVKALGLPLDQVVVIGSGILDELGIRQSNDIDLVASEYLFSKMPVDNGWLERSRAEKTFFVNEEELIELWANLPFSDGSLNFGQLLERSELINDVNFTTLDFVKNWKIWRGRDKDLQDVKLINVYLGGQA